MALARFLQQALGTAQRRHQSPFFLGLPLFLCPTLLTIHHLTYFDVNVDSDNALPPKTRIEQLQLHHTRRPC